MAACVLRLFWRSCELYWIPLSSIWPCRALAASTSVGEPAIPTPEAPAWARACACSRSCLCARGGIEAYPATLRLIRSASIAGTYSKTPNALFSWQPRHLATSVDTSFLKQWQNLFIEELEPARQHFGVGRISRDIDGDQLRNRLPLPRSFNPIFHCADISV